MAKLLVPAFIVSLLSVLLVNCQTFKFVRNPEALIPIMPKAKRPIPFALVLGSGGARGLAHIGVLEVLEEEGLIPDLIVGCSAGAIIGGLYASRVDSKWLKNLMLPKSAAHFLAFHVADFPFGVLSSSGLETFLSEHFGNRRFQDLKIPFVAVATNLQNGLLYPFFTGPIVKPVLASSAIPGAFNPVLMYGTHFVDGGVADPVPVQTARDLDAQVVVAVEVPEELSDEPPSNLLDVMWRSLVINYTALSKLSAQRADVVIHIPIADVGMFSDEKNVNLYLLGRKKAKMALPQIKKLLAQAKARAPGR